MLYCFNLCHKGSYCILTGCVSASVYVSAANYEENVSNVKTWAASSNRTNIFLHFVIERGVSCFDNFPKRTLNQMIEKEFWTLRPLPLRPRLDTSALFGKDTSVPRQDTSAPHEKTLRPLNFDTYHFGPFVSYA